MIFYLHNKVNAVFRSKKIVIKPDYVYVFRMFKLLDAAFPRCGCDHGKPVLDKRVRKRPRERLVVLKYQYRMFLLFSHMIILTSFLFMQKSVCPLYETSCSCLFYHAGKRKKDVECRAMVFFRLKRDLPACKFNDRLHDVHTQTRSLGVFLTDIVGAKKFLEDLSVLAFGNTVAVIGNADVKGVPFYADFDGDRPSRLRIFDRVGK